MCWCNPKLRTPCCGGMNCHPSSEQITKNAKIDITEPLGESGLTLLDINSGNEILKQSSLTLWQNYCDKKQECEEWKELFEKTLTMLEYSHITCESRYDYQKVSDFIKDTYKFLEGK
tara:strand:- start:10989 stop:11339 length:351 start_codon:yes stop_codon:yes gene_type:complete